MTTYTTIDRTEFENFLADAFGEFERVDRAHTKELVYDVPTEFDDIVVRVFSSVDERDETTRDAGRDAIRTLAWDVKADKPVDGASRTHRIETWRKNLAKKVNEMLTAAEEHTREDEREAAVAALEDLPFASGDDDEIVACDIVETEYGPKFAVESPYAAKDAIKSLDWDDTHRSWDSDLSMWLIDVDAVETAADALAREGWTLVQDSRFEDDEDDEFDIRTVERADVVRDDDIEVEYVPKNHLREDDPKTLTKSGTVVRVHGREADRLRITFERDDGQRMWVDDEGLHTVGSHAPFVGKVVRLTVTPFDIDDDPLAEPLTWE
jgi:hypothetical protein